MVVKMAIKDVCRLCLTEDDLVWIFDKRFESSEKMTDVIYITTGVEITINDIISQKICRKCCQVTIKMFEFRRTSLKNDQHLKEQFKVFLRDKEMKIPNTEVTIRGEGKNSPKTSDNGENTSPKKDTSEPKKEMKLYNKIHPSVRELFKVYPQIKLPTVCLKYNMAPSVSMKMDQVEQYFKSRKLDIQKYTKLALRCGKVATKKTSALHKAKSVVPPKTAVTPKIIRIERKTNVETKNDLTPIKIKLPVPLSTEKIIHPDDSNSVAVKNVEEQSSSNKRKFVEADKVEQKEAKKCNFVESLGLTPKPIESTAAAPSYVSNKSAPLFICEICNSVQYNVKDLKKHQNKHLRCQFCKMKFRSLENKDEHLKSMCPIKNMMNDLPDVKLQKVEFNKYARSTYPNAFESFSPLHSVKIEDSLEARNSDMNVSSVESDSKDHSDNVVSKDDAQKPAVTLEPSEVIEILSDDEEPKYPSVSGVKGGDPTQQTSQNIPTPNGAQNPQLENVVYNTVSIVKPDIKIKGNCALDMIDARLTDIKVLKELLTHYRPIKVFEEKNIQTELPVNDSIIVSLLDMSAELKMLKPQLHVYKVPIVIKNGIFNVTYNYTIQQKPQKKLCLWNDLNVIDIKPSNVKITTKVVPNENVNNQNILPSTAAYNSTGIFNIPTQLTSPTTSKFIRVNTSSLSPITTASFISPPSNFVSVNSQLNSVVQNVASPATITSTTAQTSNADTPAPVANRGPQFGSIRVKNVWELT